MTQVQNNIDKKRIAKNTLYLYIRMLLLLGVNFFAVRLVLNILGVDDYGIFELIFGFVVMFMTLNAALTGMVHRFLCYEMGKGNYNNVRVVFSISLLFFIAAALLYILLSETIGLWFVCNKLNIPASRMSAAQIVYQIAILTVAIKTIQIPYMAMVTAFEKMVIFTKIGIIEAIGQLLSVLVLKFITFDYLITYSFFYMLNIAIVTAIYIIYSHLSFAECRLTKKITKARVAAMGGFFSWATLGALSHVFQLQGVNILLNIFCSVALNATFGLANKLGGVISQFSGRFQMALNPQIVKSYGAKDNKSFFELIISATRYSFLLVWIFALPLFIQAEFFLKLWLGAALPEDLVIFVKITVLSSVINAINGPLWTAGQSDGKIKIYQLWISSLLFLTFAFSWIALRCGGSARWIPAINLGITAITWAFRVLYLKHIYSLPLKQYLRNAVAVIIIISITSVVIPFLFKDMFSPSFAGNVIFLLSYSIVNLAISFKFGLRHSERDFCIRKIKRVFAK